MEIGGKVSSIENLERYTLAEFKEKE